MLIYQQLIERLIFLRLIIIIILLISIFDTTITCFKKKQIFVFAIQLRLDINNNNSKIFKERRQQYNKTILIIKIRYILQR